jgi:hypothetical protein
MRERCSWKAFFQGASLGWAGSRRAWDVMVRRERLPLPLKERRWCERRESDEDAMVAALWRLAFREWRAGRTGFVECVVAAWWLGMKTGVKTGEALEELMRKCRGPKVRLMVIS